MIIQRSCFVENRQNAENISLSTVNTLRFLSILHESRLLFVLNQKKKTLANICFCFLENNQQLCLFPGMFLFLAWTKPVSEP